MLTRIKIGFFVFSVVLFLGGCAGNWWSKINRNRAKATDPSKVIARTHISSLHNITLMLPLSGKNELAYTGQAIRNGFLAAYDHSRSQQPNINIKVIDTTQGEISLLYQQAVLGGADIIVGPLTKQEVESVSNLEPLMVPTLALNTVDNYLYSFKPNLYQFGLSPQDEAVQVAVKMNQAQLGHVAIIAPKGEWGERIVSVFKNQYESAKEGETVVAVLQYDLNDLAGQICNFLASEPDKLCGYQEHKDKLKFVEPKRRQDIDSIFLIAVSPKQARQIVPLLKFYYANDLPIYSISTVYNGSSRPRLDQELNGIHFCDMPWVLGAPGSLDSKLQSIYAQITATGIWADSFAKYSKFYALGVDAYNLVISFNNLLNAPFGGMDGASGKLYLDNFNHIYRELLWAQMNGGVVQVTP